MEPLDIKKRKGEFFKVVSETPRSQISVMTLRPGQDSGPEDIHPGDQVVYVIEGTAEIELERKRHTVGEGMVFTIPAKAQHHIYNTSSEDLFVMSVYAPPAY